MTARSLGVVLAAAVSFAPAAPSSGATAALPPEEREWLNVFVAPIILPAERKFFLELTTSWQRELFKEDFWSRREAPNLPAPLGPGYRTRYEELRRAADEHYDGWQFDAGRTVIRNGIPSSIDHLEGCDQTFRDLEIWTYQTPGRGRTLLLFFRNGPLEPRRMWTTAVPQSDVFRPGTCRTSFAQLAFECEQNLPKPLVDPCFGTVCAAQCRILEAFEEISGRQGGAVAGAVELAQWIAPMSVSVEGLDQLRGRFAALGKAGARTIGAVPAAEPAESIPASPVTARSDDLRDRILSLDRRSREWLDLARPILSEQELLDFLGLPESGRAAFIRRFWKRHS